MNQVRRPFPLNGFDMYFESAHDFRWRYIGVRLVVFEAEFFNDGPNLRAWIMSGVRRPVIAFLTDGLFHV